jgi:diacylglycerol kinase family enzyme
LVRSPAYRDDKRGTTLAMLPDLLSADGTHKLIARAETTAVEGPQAILVSNNPYETNDIAGLGRRDRLDTGRLGVIAVKVASAAQAVSLVRAGSVVSGGRPPGSPRGGTGLTVLESREITVDAPTEEIPVGIDGETVLMPTPVRCSIEPKALKVVLPKHRPGRTPARSAFGWDKLLRLAFSVGETRSAATR